ncbi:MAG: hypothetical protein FWE63_07160 [Bacteroidales bacterium]|nr:hypothetical protein [Bacteroidales bacterium]
MTDTLTTITGIIESRSYDGIDLINKVDAFYNNAWGKLIIFGTIVFTLVGLIVPWSIQRYQNKLLKLSEESLKKDIKDQTDKIKGEIFDELSKKVEEKIKEYDVKIDELKAEMNATAFHLQGNTFLEKGSYKNALGDFIIAARDYLKCNDYLNLQGVLSEISVCLSKLSIEEIEELKIINSDIGLLIEKLEEKNNNGALTQIIRDIKLEVQKASKRIKEKPQEE